MSYRVFLTTLTLALAACSPSPQSPSDKETLTHGPRFPWAVDALVRDVLEPRLSHGLAASGFFRPNLGPDWRPRTEQTASLVSQSRIVYVFAMGYEVTEDPRFLTAMRKAADFLVSRFASKDRPGFWARAVKENGEIELERFHAYGSAQAIFALAHAYKVTGDQRYLDAAMHTWVIMDVPNAIEGVNDHYELRGLNVAMHLFESLLTLYKATRSDVIWGELTSLAEYIVTHFYDANGGFFAEGLSADLTPRPNGEIRLGHNIEMAFLLSRAIDDGLPVSYLDPAHAAVSFVVEIAARDPMGLIPHTADYAGLAKDREYYWWSQTEFLRGLSHFVVHRGRADLQTQLDRAVAQVEDNFLDRINGGWHRKPNGHNEDKGNGWKVGYHVTMYLTELIRLDKRSFRSGLEVLL